MITKNRLIVGVIVIAILAVSLSIVGGSGENVAVRAFNDVWVNGNVAEASNYFAPNYEGYYVGIGTKRGPEGVKESFEIYRSGLSNLRYTVEQTVVAEDKTAIVWRATGVHSNELFGIPATNKEIEIQGITVYKVVNGQIVEGSQYWHTPALLNQLNQLPPDVLNLSEYTSSVQAHTPMMHELVGLDEVLAQSNRAYGTTQEDNMSTVSAFIAETCSDQEIQQIQANLAGFFSEDFMDHSTFEQFQSGATTGQANQAVIEVMAAVSNVFPSEIFVDDMFAEGDFVVVQNTLDMTQQIKLFGVDPDPNGEGFLSQRIDVMRLVDGKIVEHWAGDDLGAFYHLGVVHNATR